MCFILFNISMPVYYLREAYPPEWSIACKYLTRDKTHLAIMTSGTTLIKAFYGTLS
jgi:hypothetical protein